MYFPLFCVIPAIIKHLSRYAEGVYKLVVPVLPVTPTWWPKACKQAESWLKLSKKANIGPLLTPSKKGFVERALKPDLFAVRIYAR